MTAAPVPGQPSRAGAASALPVAVVLLGTELLLVAFSIGSAVLQQPALAIMAGTASITLAGEIVRRFPLPPIWPSPDPSAPPVDPPPAPGPGA